MQKALKSNPKADLRLGVFRLAVGLSFDSYGVNTSTEVPACDNG